MQGTALTPEEIQRIVKLLTETQMTMPEIAMRMRCSRSAVLSINRKFKVRDYQGHRNRWQTSESCPAPAEALADTAANESISAA